MKRARTLIGSLAIAALLPLGATTVAFADEPKPDTPTDGAKPDDTPKAKKKRKGKRGKKGFAQRFGGLKALKEQLGLTDEQAQQLRGVFRGMQQQRRELVKKMREEGLSREEIRKAAKDLAKNARKDVQAKLAEILTPEQIDKMKELRKQRMKNGRRGRRGMGRRGGDGFGKQQRQQAIKLLNLNEEEAAVLVPMLDGVLETRKLLRQEAERSRQKFLQQVKETQDEAKLKELVDQYRKERQQDRERLKKAQDQLLEALTPQQEAILLALDVLR